MECASGLLIKSDTNSPLRRRRPKLQRTDGFIYMDDPWNIDSDRRFLNAVFSIRRINEDNVHANRETHANLLKINN